MATFNHEYGHFISINGTGGQFCPGRGWVRWGDLLADCDGIQSAAILHMPIWPAGAFHVWRRTGASALAVPIRSDGWLLVIGMLRRWLWLAGLVGIVTGIFGVQACLSPRPAEFEDAWLILPAAILIAMPVLLESAAVTMDRRHRAIRRVLGRHQYGSSDPATWDARLLQGLPPLQRMFTTQTPALAVPGLLARGDFSGAMLAARMEVRLGNESQGEQATDRILANPVVRAALAQVEADPGRWLELMARAGDDRTVLPPLQCEPMEVCVR